MVLSQEIPLLYTVFTQWLFYCCLCWPCSCAHEYNYVVRPLIPPVTNGNLPHNYISHGTAIATQKVYILLFVLTPCKRHIIAIHLRSFFTCCNTAGKKAPQMNSMKKASHLTAVHDVWWLAEMRVFLNEQFAWQIEDQLDQWVSKWEINCTLGAQRPVGCSCHLIFMIFSLWCMLHAADLRLCVYMLDMETIKYECTPLEQDWDYGALLSRIAEQSEQNIVTCRFSIQVRT